MRELKQSMKKEAAQQLPVESLRCECGNLLARLVPAGVEIKCRRCKRQIIIPLTSHTTVKNPLAGRKT
jgi:phage FluMu protein Com